MLQDNIEQEYYLLQDGAGVYGLPSAACLVVCDRFMFLYDSSICFNCIGL